MKSLTILLLSGVFFGLNTPVQAGDPYDTNVPEIEQFESKANIERAYNTLKEKFNIDTSFKFKQEALNTLVCDGNWGTALCHFYQKDRYFAFQLDNLDEISTFPLELVQDEKEETIFKNLTFENESVYLKISPNPFKKECNLWLEHAQSTSQKDWDFFSSSFQEVNKNCPLKIKVQEVYKRKDIQQIEKMLKLKAITDRTFQFKQQALNYILCDTNDMKYPLCKLHLKGLEIGFGLKNPKDFHVSIPEIVEDKPDQTILKYFDVKGNISYTKYEPLDRRKDPCAISFVSTMGDNVSDLETMKNVSFGIIESLAPFCTTLNKL